MSVFAPDGNDKILVATAKATDTHKWGDFQDRHVLGKAIRKRMPKLWDATFGTWERMEKAGSDDPAWASGFEFRDGYSLPAMGLSLSGLEILGAIVCANARAKGFRLLLFASREVYRMAGPADFAVGIAEFPLESGWDKPEDFYLSSKDRDIVAQLVDYAYGKSSYGRRKEHLSDLADLYDIHFVGDRDEIARILTDPSGTCHVSFGTSPLAEGDETSVMGTSWTPVAHETPETLETPDVAETSEAPEAPETADVADEGRQDDDFEDYVPSAGEGVPSRPSAGIGGTSPVSPTVPPTTSSVVPSTMPPIAAPTQGSVMETGESYAEPQDVASQAARQDVLTQEQVAQPDGTGSAPDVADDDDTSDFTDYEDDFEDDDGTGRHDAYGTSEDAVAIVLPSDDEDDFIDVSEAEVAGDDRSVVATICDIVADVTGHQPDPMVMVLASDAAQPGNVSVCDDQTLVASVAAAASACSGRRVHVMVEGDDEAAKASEALSPVIGRLGMRCSALRKGQPADERRRACEADVVFASANELGCWHIRTQSGRRDEDVPMPHDHLIVTHADDLLASGDKTTVTLRASSSPSSARAYALVADAVRDLVPSPSTSPGERAADESGYDCVPVPADKAVRLTDRGKATVLARLEHHVGEIGRDKDVLARHIRLALVAKCLLARDEDYVVADGEVQVLDAKTGRPVPGARWSGGLHEAVEAKEGLTVRDMGEVIGSVSVSRLAESYAALSATASGDDEAEMTVLAERHGLRTI